MPPVEPIEDPEDSRLADYRDIRDAQRRLRTGTFIAEGARWCAASSTRAAIARAPALVTPPALEALGPALDRGGRADVSGAAPRSSRRSSASSSTTAASPSASVARRLRGCGVRGGANRPGGGARGSGGREQCGRDVPQRAGARRRRGAALARHRRSAVPESHPRVGGGDGGPALRSPARLAARSQSACATPATPSSR